MTTLMKRLGAIWVARQLAKAILKPLVIWAHRLGRLLAPAAATVGRACVNAKAKYDANPCLLYTSPSPRDVEESRMPSSA